MQKFAFFDFCDTLVSFQTADAFVNYVRKAEGNSFMRCIEMLLIGLSNAKIIAILDEFLPNSALEKKIKLLQLRGFTYEKLDNLAESYYKEMIKPKLIGPVIAEMQKLVQQEYKICLVSAGYSIYLKYFATDYQINSIISTEIAFDQDSHRCMGTILGKDCIHYEKVNRIKSYFLGQNVDYNESISYSDSITDLPMLKLTGKSVVVSRSASQSWNNRYKFNEIIWK
jgi:HAD superfamily hydrolase (TIGR01490 family)